MAATRAIQKAKRENVMTPSPFTASPKGERAPEWERMLLALWRAPAERTMTGLGVREPERGPGYLVRPRRAAVGRQVEPTYPTPVRALPGPMEEAALPAALPAALAAQQLAAQAVAPHLVPAFLAAVAAVGLQAALRRFGGPAMPGPVADSAWFTAPGGLIVGPGWIDVTDAGQLDYPRDSAVDWAGGGQFWRGWTPAVGVPRQSFPIPGGVYNQVTVFGTKTYGDGHADGKFVAAPQDWPYPLSTYYFDRDYAVPANQQGEIALGSIVLPLPEAAAPPRVGWRGAARARSSPWPQGWQGGYAPPVAERVAAVGSHAPAWPENLGRRAKEKKWRQGLHPSTVEVLKQTTRGRAILEQLLEVGDAVSAVFMALPPQIRALEQRRWYEEQFDAGNLVPGPMSAQAKAAAITRHHRHLDGEAVLRELLWENFQDQMYGGMSQGTQEALGRILGPRRSVLPSTTVSPGYEHVLDPMLPFQGPRRVRDPQTGQWQVVPAGPLHFVMQEITGRAARDARYREAPDPALAAEAIAEGQRRRRAVRRERERKRDFAVWRAGTGSKSYDYAKLWRETRKAVVSPR